MRRRILPFFSIAIVLLSLADPAPATAQQPQPAEPEGWSLYLQRPGSRHEVDTMAFIRKGRDQYRFMHRVTLDQPFANPAGERFDRVVSVSEYDCRRARYRDEHASLSLGEEEFRTEHFTDGAWMEPEPAFREVFDRTCAYLVALGARLPAGQESYSIRFVEEMPELANRSEIGRALSREYPPTQRNAGVGGQAVLNFRVLGDGSVERASISVRAATMADFGDAAARVVSRMRFKPAKLGGRPVAVWITLPVSFTIMDESVFPSVSDARWCTTSGSSFCGGQ